MKRVLLASACALALSGAMSAPAFAAAITIDGAYQHADLGGGGPGVGVDGYNMNGAVNLALPWSPLSLEFDIGDEGLSSLHNFDVGGAIVWTDPDFRLALTGVNNHNAGATDFDEANIGLGGEWYFNDQITVGAHGGLVAGRIAGAFGSGAVKFYPLPDLSVGGTIDYTSFKSIFHETDFGAKAEYMVDEDWPLTIQGGYKHEDLGGFHAHANVFWIGARLYLDSGMKPMPLIEHNRTGTLDTIGPTHPFIFDIL